MTECVYDQEFSVNDLFKQVIGKWQIKGTDGV